MKLEIIFTKERLKELGIKPNLFYYTIDDHSHIRGYNKSFSLMVLRKDMQPLCIGEAHVSTASYKGESATIHNMISKIMGRKMFDGYRLESKKIKIFQM